MDWTFGQLTLLEMDRALQRANLSPLSHDAAPAEIDRWNTAAEQALGDALKRKRERLVKRILKERGSAMETQTQTYNGEISILDWRNAEIEHLEALLEDRGREITRLLRAVRDVLDHDIPVGEERRPRWWMLRHLAGSI